MAVLGPERRERNRRRNWLLITVVLVMIVVLQAASFEPRPAHPYFGFETPYVLAHQGGDGERPGNTLVAFAHAHALGVDVLEMDVQLSADAELVVIHDSTVERTTDGRGAVAGMTLAELQALDAAWHWPYSGDARPWRGRGVRIPALAEVLERFPLARYNIEMKADDPALGEALCALVRAHGAQSQVLVASFHTAPMQRFRAACPDAATSALPWEVRVLKLASWVRLPWLYRADADAVQVPLTWAGLSVVDEAFLDTAAAANVHVDVWTVDDPVQLERLTGMGIGGVITDRPSRYLALLGRAGALQVGDTAGP